MDHINEITNKLVSVMEAVIAQQLSKVSIMQVKGQTDEAISKT